MKRGPKRLRHSYGNLADERGVGCGWMGVRGACLSGEGGRKE